MNTTKQLFAHLNKLRAISNQAPLKAWKESRIKLIAAIAKLQPSFDPSISLEVAAPGVTSETLAKTMAPAKKTPESKRLQKALAKKMAPKKTIAKKAAPKKTDGTSISLAEIARQLDMNPKAARAKMRRCTDFDSCQVSKYVYPVEYAEAVKAFLTTDQRKN